MIRASEDECADGAQAVVERGASCSRGVAPRCLQRSGGRGAQRLVCAVAALAMAWTGTASRRLAVADDKPPGLEASRWVYEQARSMEASYLAGQLGATCDVARRVAREAATLLLDGLESSPPVVVSRFALESDLIRRPSIEQVAFGKFRLEIRYLAKDGGSVRVIREPIEESEVARIVAQSKSDSAGEVYRDGPLLGTWTDGVLTVPLSLQGAGDAVRAVPEGSALPSEAEEILGRVFLLGWGNPTDLPWVGREPVVGEIDRLKKQGERGGRPRAALVLRSATAILRNIQLEWIGRVLDELRVSGATRLGEQHDLILSRIVNSGLIAEGRLPGVSGEVEYVILVDGSFRDEIASGVTGGLRRRDWSYHRVDAWMIPYCRDDALQLEEAVFPSLGARARVWLRSAVSGAAAEGEVLPRLRQVKAKRLLELLNSAP